MSFGPPAYAPAPPPPGPYQYHRPGGSKALAYWALGLSIFPCLFGWVVAVVFACITLSRSRRTGEWGRGYAIAALVVVGAWILVAVGLVAYALSLSVEREDGVIVQGGNLGVYQLAVGDCFDLPDGRSGDLMAAIVSTSSPEVSSVDAVPCAEPHDAEVYANFDLRNGYYPGDALVVEQAQVGCALRFQPFVGLAYERSVLEIYFFHPGRYGWKQGNDREVVCAIMEPSGQTTDDTLRDARR